MDLDDIASLPEIETTRIITVEVSANGDYTIHRSGKPTSLEEGTVILHSATKIMLEKLKEERAIKKINTNTLTILEDEQSNFINKRD